MLNPALSPLLQTQTPLYQRLREDEAHRRLETYAARAALPVRDVELQTLLHLPRGVADDKAFDPAAPLYGEVIEQSIALLHARMNGFEDWLVAPAESHHALAQLEFGCVPEEEALLIHRCFHYIGSPRPNSLHFGLRLPQSGRLAALLSFSPFDLPYMAAGLPPEITPAAVMMLSRAFAFEWAPANKMSYLMGKVWHWFAGARPAIKMFLTYVNPNLGFTGAAYRAANWLYFGEEGETRYAYLDRVYITDRRLVELFGTANPTLLRRRLKSRFSLAQLPLAPLQLFAYFNTRALRRRSTSPFDFHFTRPLAPLAAA